ncbi:hypothetical protein DPMN_087285 [Dreissena polymorpha]|uniref:Uncharacterized protein n=1 Tax=Dreissena polymorpha TaxID=45954 RepID=A0A9D4KSE5_DREPO|nr:hypothetical protein DPMN_087285 [Dreissena polymorpha]
MCGGRQFKDNSCLAALNHCIFILYGYTAWGTPIFEFWLTANLAVERTSGSSDDRTRLISRAAYRSTPIQQRSHQENLLRLTLAPVAMYMGELPVDFGWRLHETLTDGGKPSSTGTKPVEECLRLNRGPLDKGCRWQNSLSESKQHYPDPHPLVAACGGSHGRAVEFIKEHGCSHRRMLDSSLVVLGSRKPGCPLGYNTEQLMQRNNPIQLDGILRTP